MSIAAETQLGPYKIIALIGAGGMGEVYRARDTRLLRDVALKLLPESFTADPDRLRRFEQEARAVAALNHPNIVSVFDLQRGGVHYIVWEPSRRNAAATHFIFGDGGAQSHRTRGPDCRKVWGQPTNKVLFTVTLSPRTSS